jgi:hypothetical protein
MRIKVTSHLATLNHSRAHLGILKRQQTLDPFAFNFSADPWFHDSTVLIGLLAALLLTLVVSALMRF